MPKLHELVRSILTDNDVDPREACWDCHGRWVIDHKYLERIADRNGITFDAPQGPVEVMPNHHLSQTVRIGQITADGQFEILEETDGPVSPQAWNQIHPDSKGFACDWTDANKGGKYKL